MRSASSAAAAFFRVASSSSSSLPPKAGSLPVLVVLGIAGVLLDVDLVGLAVDRHLLLGLGRGRVADRVDGGIAMRRLLFEHLFGFLEPLRLAAAVLGGGALGRVHPLHAAAAADS